MARTATTVPVLEKHKHKDGCPQKDARVESYTTTRPNGQTVRVTRCLDCGGHDVRDLQAGAVPPTEQDEQGDDA